MKRSVQRVAERIRWQPHRYITDAGACLPMTHSGEARRAIVYATTLTLYRIMRGEPSR